MPLSDGQRSLLLKFIAGEADHEESERVENLLAENPDVFSEFEQLWELWNAVGTATNVNKFNVDNGWEALLSKGLANRQKSGKKNRIIIIAASVAAALVIWLGWSFMSNGTFDRETPFQPNEQLTASVNETPVIKEAEKNNDVYVKTNAGVRKKIKLPDGSTVWLNGGSLIRYPGSAGEHERELYLRGQAFFDIKHNERKPFIVKTDHATIKVLGTRFDLVAYPKEEITEAVLTGGSILFTTESDHKQISKKISPGQKISLNYLSGKLQVTDVDTAFYASWKEGKLLFRNERFQTVARAMDHKYNINILFLNTSLENKRLSGYLEKESLEEALKALQLTLQFKYDIKDDTVLISR